ncbi:MAG: CHAD domain-containing protein [Parafilimonas sp.]
MLKKRRQYKFLEKRCNAMQTHITDFVIKEDFEALHELRVEIKKLRAFAAFAEKYTEGNFSKTLKPVIKIFKYAGRIRTAQLNLQMIKKHKIGNADFINNQQVFCQENSDKFKDSLKFYINTIQKFCKKIKSKFHDIENKKIVVFYKKQLDFLKSFFQEELDEKKLHECRKKIKLLLYMENLLPKKVKQKLKLNKTYLDKLQDAIGKWHDAVLTAELLKTRNLTGEEKLKQIFNKKNKLLQTVKLLAKFFEEKVTRLPY